MNLLPPLAAVVSFFDCINRSDLEGLGRLMTEDHHLIVFDETPVVGREPNIEAWRGYMDSFPRYVIYPQRLAWSGDRVAVLGSTMGSHLGLPDDEELRLLLIWLASVREGRLASWELVEDTPARRAELGLS